MDRLRIASDIGEFMRRPVGAGVLVETNFLWCASPSLGGTIGWGSPTGEQAQRVMEVVAAIFHPTIGPELDLVLDGFRLEQVNPGVVMAIFEWTRRNLDALKRRIRRQVGVSPPGLGGILLAGMLPMLGNPYGFEIVATPKQAYRLLLGNDEGDALHDEIMAHVDRFSRTPPLVGELRNLLRAHQGNLTVEQAAGMLGRSPRSLQRELEAVATSFRREQAQVRLIAAEELLAASDDKLAVIAARLGLSVHGLNRLIRDRMGTTLEAWRRLLRNR
jgi:AraC-like DNA-binding protein